MKSRQSISVNTTNNTYVPQEVGISELANLLRYDRISGYTELTKGYQVFYSQTFFLHFPLEHSVHSAISLQCIYRYCTIAPSHYRYHTIMSSSSHYYRCIVPQTETSMLRQGTVVTTLSISDAILTVCHFQLFWLTFVFSLSLTWTFSSSS